MKTENTTNTLISQAIFLDEPRDLPPLAGGLSGPPGRWELCPDLKTQGKSHLEILAGHGAVDAREILLREARRDQPRRKRQPENERSTLIRQAHDGLGQVVDAELKAGYTVRQQIEADRRLNAAFGTGRDRASVTKRCLGQRNALIRVLQVQTGQDHFHEPTEAVMAFLDIALALSANAAVLSGSRWTSTQTWLERNLPMITHVLGAARLKKDFDRHVSRANAVLAATIPVRVEDYRTAPSAKDIAERMTITTAQLRTARANQVGLTSINPETKRQRDRRYAETKRRDEGRVPQAQRTQRKDDITLAASLGVTDRAIRLWRKNGRLENELAKRGAAFPKVSSG